MSRKDIPDACLNVGEKIESYLNGELTAVEQAEIAAHLASCPECRADLAFAQRIADTLHSLPQERCPDRVIERVYERVVPPRSTFRDRWRVPTWRPVLIGSCAALLLAVTALIGQKEMTTPRYAEADIRAAEREARWALAYIGLLGERTGKTVKSSVIDERIILPVVRTLEKSLDRDNADPKGEVRNAG